MLRTPIVPMLLSFLILLLAACTEGEGDSGGGGGSTTPPALSITTASLPNATDGLAYTTPVTATGGTGAGYGWSVSAGSLPPGLTLTGGTPDATISGSPTSSGLFNFTLQVTDSGANTASRALSIDVAAVAALTITTTSLPGGTASVAYSQPISATGGSGYAWSVISGTAPTGLTLSSGTPSATLAGTPSAAGTFNFTVQVTDSASNTDTQLFSITINAALTITTASLPGGTEASFYQQTISATGGTGAGYTWSVVSGTAPAGLALIGGTPSTSYEGTPTTAGTYNFTVQVQDSASSVDTQAFTVVIATNPTLVITTSSLPAGSVAQAYSQPIAAAGGTQPYTWSITGGYLGWGLSLASGTPNATVSGMPRYATSMNFDVQVMDNVGATAYASFTLVIQPSTLSIVNTTPGQAAEGVPYSFTATAQGGTGYISAWSVVSGILPTGLSLVAGNPWAGMYGTPTTAGSYVFTLQCQDSASSVATRQFTINVGAATGALMIATQALGPFGVNAAVASPILVAIGGAGGYSWALASGSQVPPGMGITQAGADYRLSGTPTQTGSYNVTLQVTDSATATATRAYTVVVEDYASVFGVATRQKTVFIMDASGSMAGTRIALLRAEMSATINNMPANQEFDCIAYGDQFGAGAYYSVYMWGTLLPATASNKTAATNWVNGAATNPGGGTPTYPCVQRACQVYSADLKCMVVLTDGYPSTGGSATQILTDFPAWFHKFDDCRLITVSIANGSISAFLMAWAAEGNGYYVAA